MFSLDFPSQWFVEQKINEVNFLKIDASLRGETFELDFVDSGFWFVVDHNNHAVFEQA